MARRLPLYILLDTSGSMIGEPIEAVNIGLRTLVNSLKQNAYANTSVHLCIVTFDSIITEVLPLTSLVNLAIPEIVCPKSGGTFLGAALEFIHQRFNQNFIPPSTDAEGDREPMLLIMTDGKCTDTQAYEEAIPKIQQLPFATIIACAAGPKSVPDQLRQLTNTVIGLDTMDGASFTQFFKWAGDAVTSTESAGSSQKLEKSSLPPPPPELQIVL